MDKISDKIQVDRQRLQKQSETLVVETSKKTALPINWISALFIKFQSRYLHKWTSAIDGVEETVIKEWAEQLAGLTGEQIKNGLDTWTEDWPPCAPEFRKRCLDKSNNEAWQHKTAAYREYIPPSRQLVKKCTPEVAEKSLEEMKSKLGITNRKK